MQELSFRGVNILLAHTLLPPGDTTFELLGVTTSMLQRQMPAHRKARKKVVSPGGSSVWAKRILTETHFELFRCQTMLCFEGLVTVDKQSNIIRLVHYTAQEYFERNQSTWFPKVLHRQRLYRLGRVDSLCQDPIPQLQQ
jgi:hypothetical protein